MKIKKINRNVLFALIAALFSLLYLVFGIAAPGMIFPSGSILLHIALLLVSMVIAGFLGCEYEVSVKSVLTDAVFGALIHSLILMPCGLVAPSGVIRAAAIGFVISGLLPILYHTMLDLAVDVKTKKLAGIVDAVCLYLACQCLLGF